MVSLGRLDYLDERLQVVEEAFGEGRFEDAARIAEEALNSHVGPVQSAQLHELCASALEVLGRYEECVVSCRLWMNVFGPCLDNLRLLLECAYLLERASLVEQCIVEIAEMFLAAEQRPGGQGLDACCTHASYAEGGDNVGPAESPEQLEAEDLFQYLFLLGICYLSDLGKRLDFEKMPMRILPPAEVLRKNERLMVVVGYSELVTGKESHGTALLEDVISRREEDECLAGALLCLREAEQGHVEKALQRFGRMIANVLNGDGDAAVDGFALPLELFDLLDALPWFAEIALDFHPEVAPLMSERRLAMQEDSPEPRRFSSLLFKRRC